MLRLRTEPAVAALRLSTDGLLLSRAVANLIDNACKFTPKGGEVEVTAHARADCVELAVLDTGPGISDKDLGRLGERFYRGAPYRGSIEGFGLGLALAREFVTALGGTIRLRNRPGGGTEALITLSTAPLLPRLDADEESTNKRLRGHLGGILSG